jgi:Cu-processing system permease protein
MKKNSAMMLTIYVMVGIMALFFFIVLNYQAMTPDQVIENLLYRQGADGTWEQVPHVAWVKTAFLLKAAGIATVKGFLNILGFAFRPDAVSQNLLIVVGMTCLELMIVTAFAVLYSSFSTPTLSAVFTVMTFMAGRLNEDIMRFADRVLQQALQAAAAAKATALPMSVEFKVWFAKIASLIVPNLDSLNVSSQAIYKEQMDVWRYPALYAVCYTGCILMIAILIFRRRNFK